MESRLSADEFDERVSKIAALAEPMRRALYRYVVAQPDPVGRRQAADAVGVAHHAAKFHLDKLEADGLLDIEYSRPPGCRGPGAGRPAKRYRRSSTEVAVSLPERRYGLAGRVMAEAIATAAKSGVAITQALRDAAAAAGRALGEQARDQAGHRAGRAATVRVIGDVLAECGYEPRQAGDAIILANCPFHTLAETYTELVCGMNLDLLDGLVTACERSGLRAELNPEPGRCCVTIGSLPKAGALDPARQGRALGRSRMGRDQLGVDAPG
jgi:predicted ArsR family transcriptional regulator